MEPEGMQQMQDWGQKPERRETALDHLDSQLEKLEKNLAIANERLDPVLSRYDSEPSDMPVPEPDSALRARAERLRECNARFERLINQLDI